MSDVMGPIALEGAGGKPLYGQGHLETEYSEEVGAAIDAEVSRVISENLKRAEDIIKKHRKVLNAIAERLVEVETIEQKEFEDLITAHGINPKRKKDIEHQK
jgi:cell division protease FtsH